MELQNLKLKRIEKLELTYMDVEEIVGKVSALVPGWFAASELESVLDWQLKFSGLERG